MAPTRSRASPTTRAVRVPSALTEGLDSYEIGVRPEKIRLLEVTDPVPDGINQLHGRRPRRLVPRRVDELHGRGPRAAARSWSTSRTSSAPRGRAVGARRAGPDDLVAGPHVRGPRAAGNRLLSTRPRWPSRWAARRSRHRAGVSRRKFLVGGALAVAAVGFGAFLASTMGGGVPPAPSPSTATGPSPTPAGSATEAPSRAAASEPVPSFPPETGALQFASWLGYIDINEDDNTYPTIEKFTAETGIEVNYVESVDGNEEFFTSNLKGPLDAGLPTAWDIVVLTDWMIDRLVRLGWLEPFVRAAMPNFVANLLPLYVGRTFDPDTKYAAPWQSGMTGLGFDQNKTGPLTSLTVFFSDQFSKKMTYLTEMRDTVGLSAIIQGADPATLTEEQFQAALARSTPRSRPAGCARSRATRTSTSWPASSTASSSPTTGRRAKARSGTRWSAASGRSRSGLSSGRRSTGSSRSASPATRASRSRRRSRSRRKTSTSITAVPPDRRPTAIALFYGCNALAGVVNVDSRGRRPNP